MVGALFLFPPVQQTAERVLAETMEALQSGATPAIGAVDIVLMLIMTGVILVSIVWAVALMYRAYAVSCDTSGAKAIVSFIIALIVAEVLSKLAVYALFHAAGVTLAPPA